MTLLYFTLFIILVPITRWKNIYFAVEPTFTKHTSNVNVIDFKNCFTTETCFQKIIKCF